VTARLVIIACESCIQLRVPASSTLKALLVLGAVLTIIGLVLLAARARHLPPRAWPAVLAFALGLLLLSSAALPVINEVSTMSGSTKVFCGKPAMMFENPAFASSSPPTGDVAAAVGACRAGFTGRWGLTALIVGAGALVIAANPLRHHHRPRPSVRAG
jgi:hypothetical protein